MQAVVIIGIFGLFYATVVSLTVMLSQSAMYKKLQDVDAVRQIFTDFEFAVNKAYLGEQPDLTMVIDDGDMLFARRYMRWSQDELSIDPWGTPFTVIGDEEDRLLYADAGIDGNVMSVGDNNEVEAPVAAFALLSAGPDRVLQTKIVGINSHNKILSLEEDDANDDLIHTFTTYAAMADMWDQVRTMTDKVISIAKEDYKKQHEMFLPAIVQYYDDNGITLIDASGTIVDDTVIDSWKADATMLDMLRSADANCSPCYPEIIDDLERLGVDEEIQRLPPIVAANSFSVTRPGGLYDVIELSMEVSPVADDWNISYTVRIVGEDAIK